MHPLHVLWMCSVFSHHVFKCNMYCRYQWFVILIFSSVTLFYTPPYYNWLISSAACVPLWNSWFRLQLLLLVHGTFTTLGLIAAVTPCYIQRYRKSECVFFSSSVLWRTDSTDLKGLITFLFTADWKLFHDSVLIYPSDSFCIIVKRCCLFRLSFHDETHGFTHPWSSTKWAGALKLHHYFVEFWHWDENSKHAILVSSSMRLFWLVDRCYSLEWWLLSVVGDPDVLHYHPR